jgi:hypothetical protein
VAGAAMALCCGWGAPGAAYGAVDVLGTTGNDLWGTATIEPGRQGILEVTGYAGSPLGTGSALTLTAPDGTAVTGTPLEAGGYRGSVREAGGSGTYTFKDPSAGRWNDRTFPFVLSVPPGAQPGTRLPGCTLLLADARGTVKETGTCTVTVGLPAPTLTGPESGVPLPTRPEASGTAHPGAQITVRDEEEREICTATAATDGSWSCTPATDLPHGPGRLQATATFNGVSAHSEQIDITVRDAKGRADRPARSSCP